MCLQVREQADQKQFPKGVLAAEEDCAPELSKPIKRNVPRRLQLAAAAAEGCVDMQLQPLQTILSV